jgi:hypothetical protein
MSEDVEAVAKVLYEARKPLGEWRPARRKGIREWVTLGWDELEPEDQLESLVLARAALSAAEHAELREERDRYRKALDEIDALRFSSSMVARSTACDIARRALARHPETTSA